MKQIKIVLLIIFLTPALLFSQNEKNIKLVWPHPPEKARIEYIKKITNEEEFGIKRGFFKRILDFFMGSEKKTLIKPFGVHFDNNKLYVTDVGLRSLLIFDNDKNRLIELEGFKDEEFLYPVDVATDKKGNIYITDSMRNCVYIFNKNLIALKKIGASSGLKRPTGIAVDKEREILYISDTLDSKVKRFTLSGTKLTPIGSAGTGHGDLNRPTFIALDKEGKLYVSDSMNFRVNIYDLDGSLINSFGQIGNTIGSFASPRGISVDNDGNIYITDTLFNAIQIFNKKGDLLLVFGGEGSSDGEFYGPEDIAISEDGKIYISDSNNMRVEVFKILSYNRGK